MTCKEFAKRVSEYIEEELEEGDRAAMDRHTAACPACALLAGDLRTQGDRLSRLPRLQPPAGFDFALRGRLLREVSGERRWRRRVQKFLFPSIPRALLTGAAVVLLALGAASVLEERSDTSGPPSVYLDQRGALRQLSQEEMRPYLDHLSQSESHTISSWYYRSRPDTAGSSSGLPAGQKGLQGVERVPVRF